MMILYMTVYAFCNAFFLFVSKPNKKQIHNIFQDSKACKNTIKFPPNKTGKLYKNYRM